MLLSAGAFIRFFKLQKKLFVFKPRRKACKLPSGTYCPVAGNSQQYRVFVAGPAYRAGGVFVAYGGGYFPVGRGFAVWYSAQRPPDGLLKFSAVQLYRKIKGFTLPVKIFAYLSECFVG